MTQTEGVPGVRSRSPAQGHFPWCLGRGNAFAGYALVVQASAKSAMDDQAAVTADTLELLVLNQQALRASIEELSLWIRHRGSTDVSENVLVILETLDTNAEAIAQGIQALRS